jgi:hypothetical protein
MPIGATDLRTAALTCEPLGERQRKLFRRGRLVMADAERSVDNLGRPGSCTGQVAWKGDVLASSAPCAADAAPELPSRLTRRPAARSAMILIIPPAHKGRACSRS